MTQDQAANGSADLPDLEEFLDGDWQAAEIESLAPLAAEGMVEIDDEGITVTARGWFFVRAVAMSFDRYLRGDQARERFSRIF